MCSRFQAERLIGDQVQGTRCRSAQHQCHSRLGWSNNSWSSTVVKQELFIIHSLFRTGTQPASQGGSYNWAWGQFNLGPALRRRGRSEIKHRAQGTAQRSIIVTSGSVGPAAPGAAKRCAKSFSSSTLCSRQAHSRASQGGSCNWEWGQMLWSSTAGMELAGSNLKTGRDRLRLPAQGGWSLSRVSNSDVAALSG